MLDPYFSLILLDICYFDPFCWFTTFIFYVTIVEIVESNAELSQETRLYLWIKLWIL